MSNQNGMHNMSKLDKFWEILQLDVQELSGNDRKSHFLNVIEKHEITKPIREINEEKWAVSDLNSLMLINAIKIFYKKWNEDSYGDLFYGNAVAVKGDITKCVWAIFKREVSPPIMKQRLIRKMTEKFNKEQHMRRQAKRRAKKTECMKKRGTYIEPKKNTQSDVVVKSSRFSDDLEEICLRFVKYRRSVKIKMVFEFPNDRDYCSDPYTTWWLDKTSEGTSTLRRLEMQRYASPFSINVIGYFKKDDTVYWVSDEKAEYKYPDKNGICRKLNQVLYQFNALLTDVIISKARSYVIYSRPSTCPVESHLEYTVGQHISHGLEFLGIPSREPVTYIGSTDPMGSIPAPTPEPLIGSRLINQLKSLSDMYKAGTLTREEFTNFKERLLKDM